MISNTVGFYSALVAFVVAIPLVFAWLTTRKRILLVAATLVVVVGGGILVYALVVIDDEELVENEIRDVARDVEQNNVSAVLDHVHPEAEEIVQEAKRRLPNYDFDSVLVRIRNVEIDETKSPRTALVEFLVIVSGTTKSTNSPLPRQARPFFRVTMVEEGDRWLIRDYELRPTNEAFQKRD